MKPGDQVSDFELKDETGTPRTLSSLLTDGPVVLFFYPLAMSGGCTKEACHFRDLAADFATVNAQPVGISADSVEKQGEFVSGSSLNYPLLSDVDGVVAKEFGVWRKLVPMLRIKRQTFVIDQDRTVLAVLTGEMKFDDHADQALDVLRRRSAAA